MATQNVGIKIKGITPLLMHRFPLQPTDGLEKKTPDVQAEHSAYRDENGELYIPGVNVQRCFVNAAAFSKGKGRSNLVKIAAACLMIRPARLLLGCKTYRVDSQAVVVPATGGRIVRHRPALDEWSVSCILDYDPDLLSEKQVRAIVDDAGRRVGLLDFRPECKGPYGRFMVTEWEAK